MSILSAGKDKMIGLFLRQRLNDLLQEVGSVEALAIDTENKTLKVELQLEGEPTPVTLDVRSYRIIVEQGKSFLQIGETAVSREWMQTLVRRFLVGKRIALPEEYSDLVERLLG